MTTDAHQRSTDYLGAAHEALARGAWELARTWFEQAIAREETPEALEGLATAAWWQSDAAATFPARERAYHLYRERGDRHGAARVAAFHAIDYCSLRSEPAVANGWIRRAHRHLEDLAPCPEHAMLAAWEGHIALTVRNDLSVARSLSAQGVAVARSIGAVDWEMLALGLQGLVLVIEGEVTEGMRRLDEAATAATAGEMTDLDAIGTVYCYLIYACEQVRDYDRAAQWCAMVKEVSARWSYRFMFSVCRAHYAGVLMGQGAWDEAEQTLAVATSELAAIHPTMAAEGLARLAELRRRQGRLEEAAALLQQVESQALRRLVSKYVLLGRAALALDAGDAAGAADLAERFLRGVGAGAAAERVAGLELLVRAWTNLAVHDRASVALRELQSIAAVATEPLRGAVRFAEGIVAAAAGDYESARHGFEDAIDLFDRARSPFEAAQAHIDLARTLSSLGRSSAAAREARVALELLRRLGADREADRAASLLRTLEGPAPEPASEATDPAGLTPRELDVLRLISAGRSNQAIAADLVLSVRTVERHISAIYGKLGARGKVARAIATAYAHHHGLIEPHPGELYV